MYRFLATRFTRALFLLVITCVAGCQTSRSTYDARYQMFSHDHQLAQSQPAYATQAANPVAENYAGPHPVESYIELGLRQNPEIQEARLNVEMMANRVPQAASLPDPMLGAMAFPSPGQTAAGEQEFALSMNQKFPWRGKLATQAAMAEQDVNAARARLAEVELKVVEQIKNAYFKLYFIQQAIAIIENDRKQLELIETVVDRMYRVQGDVTQQDVLQVQVQLSQVDAELVEFRQQKTSAQARLARLLHISPETQLEALDQLPPGKTVNNIQQLYDVAIQARPELHAQLATIDRNRKAACLAQLDRYPDLTLGFNWIAIANEGLSPVANGEDDFMLTLGMNLPVYKKRIDAGVREAQTRTLASARKYDRLKDETMESVADLFAKVQSLRETLSLFHDDIIPKSKLTLEQSIENYQVGKVDFLQMIDNWRQLLRFEIAEQRFEMELQQALASLARQIGSFELPDDSPAPAGQEMLPADPSPNQDQQDNRSGNEN